MIKTPHRIMYDALGPERRDVYWKFCQNVDANTNPGFGLSVALKFTQEGHTAPYHVLGLAFDWSPGVKLIAPGAWYQLNVWLRRVDDRAYR